MIETIESIFGHSFCSSFNWSDIGVENELFISSYNKAKEINNSFAFCKNFNAIWKVSMEEIISKNLNEKISIPLSAGYDSRIILNYLLNKKLNKQIITSTFGIKGSREIECAKLISEKFNLEHQISFIDEFNFLELLNFNDKKIKNNINLLHRSLNCDCFHSKFVINGFLANTLAGNHLSSMNESFDDAFIRYINTEIDSNKLKYFFPKHYLNIREKIKSATNSRALRNLEISNFEKIIISQRQKMRIKYILGNDKEFVFSPFSNGRIAGLLLGIDSSFRYKQNFYRVWMQKNFVKEIRNLKTSKEPYLEENFLNKNLKILFKIYSNLIGKFHNVSGGFLYPYLSNYGRDNYLLFKNKSYDLILKESFNKEYFLIAKKLKLKHYANQRMISNYVSRLY